jgi:hypothetical protein
MRFGITKSGIIGASYSVGDVLHVAAGTISNTRAPQVYVLPAWLRHGTQPNYWTEAWARKEKLADYDRIAGTVYEADNMDDVIRFLDGADDAAQAD